MCQPPQLLRLFPQHVIIGWVAGFGVFLVISGLEISTGLPLRSMGFLESTSALFSEVRGAVVETIAKKSEEEVYGLRRVLGGKPAGLG